MTSRDVAVELAAAAIAEIVWEPFDDGPPGMWVKRLRVDPQTENHTRLIRVEPTVVINEIRKHDFWEETYVLEGGFDDARGHFGPGAYTCYPPGHEHGPYWTDKGWLALEFVYYDQPATR